MKFQGENKGRLNPNVKKYLTGEYKDPYTGHVKGTYDKRTDFEKKADEVLKIPKGKPTDISSHYNEYPSQKGDPLYEKSPSGVVFGEGKKFHQDENMVPVAEIEDQNFGQENDPEKTFVPIEEVADQNSLNEFDFEIEDDGLDTESEEVDENGDSMVQEYVEKKDSRNVLINGIALGDIMDRKVSEEKLPQRPVKEGFNHIEKISVNRKKEIIRQEDLDDTGKYKNTKITRRFKNTVSKNAKRQNKKTKPFKPWEKAQKQIIKGDDPRMTA